MKEWAYAVILALLFLIVIKLWGAAKSKGKEEARKEANKLDKERADELAKRLTDEHDINKHFGMHDNGDEVSNSTPRFEILPTSKGDDKQ